MLFRDREDAARQLLKLILPAGRQAQKNRYVVVSLLRGGIVIGKLIADKLRTIHLPLVVAKIPAPFQEELALGALCFDTVYLEKRVVKSLNLSKPERANQIEIAKKKFNSYLKRFKIHEKIYDKVRGETAILVDDGIATGSTARAAALYLKLKGAQEVILAVPVAPLDFDTRGFDKVIIVKQELGFSSVSQFYQNFPQIEDAEVRKILMTNNQ